MTVTDTPATGTPPLDIRRVDAYEKVTGKARYSADRVPEGVAYAAFATARFGWDQRNPEPGSMIAEDGSILGWGVAAGCYPGSIVPAVAHVSATEDGTITVAAGGHEMGQGIRSAIALLVARDLGVPVNKVIVQVGDTRLVPQHLTASALPAVRAAIDELRKALDVTAPGGVDIPAAVRAKGKSVVTAEPTTRRIRVPRVVSVVDCGRVAGPVTAASQVRGAVVMGIGAALREESDVDDRFGGFLNTTLEEYSVPVNADIHQIEVEFIDEPDLLFNPLGVKGVGEVGMVGVAAAIANAVHHATGRRMHRLLIRLENVL